MVVPEVVVHSVPRGLLLVAADVPEVAQDLPAVDVGALPLGLLNLPAFGNRAEPATLPAAGRVDGYVLLYGDALFRALGFGCLTQTLRC
jgi:hypothetical protein